MKLLVLGSDSLIIREMCPLLTDAGVDFDLIDQHKYDACSPVAPLACDMVLDAIGYTNILKAERGEKDLCSHVNVAGTFNLAFLYRDKPFVYISSEHAINPTTWLGTTKHMAEKLVRMHCSSHLILQSLFKTRPYPHPYAYADVFTRGDYIDIIAKLFVERILAWTGESETIHIGTERKTMYELAKRTKPDVKPNFAADAPVFIPKDYLIS